jgi:hypothetical protein
MTRVWAAFHEDSGDVAGGPFDNRPDAEAYIADFDDVYAAEVDRVWLERQIARIHTETAQLDACVARHPAGSRWQR